MEPIPTDSRSSDQRASLKAPTPGLVRILGTFFVFLGAVAFIQALTNSSDGVFLISVDFLCFPIGLGLTFGSSWAYWAARLFAVASIFLIPILFLIHIFPKPEWKWSIFGMELNSPLLVLVCVVLSIAMWCLTLHLLLRPAVRLYFRRL